MGTGIQCYWKSGSSTHKIFLAIWTIEPY